MYDIYIYRDIHIIYIYIYICIYTHTCITVSIFHPPLVAGRTGTDHLILILLLIHTCHILPFQPILWNRCFPPEPAKTAKYSHKSISEGGRIWQVCNTNTNHHIINNNNHINTNTANTNTTANSTTNDDASHHKDHLYMRCVRASWICALLVRVCITYIYIYIYLAWPPMCQGNV